MKDIISYHCRQTLPVFSSGDTIFISFLFIIGDIGLVCDNERYIVDRLEVGRKGEPALKTICLIRPSAY